jgi:Tol biopolymer transport system component
MIAVLSDKSLEKPFLRNNDYSQPAGFVVGLVGLTSDYASDDPAALLEDWQAQIEKDGMQLKPVGELDTSTDGTLRRASRAYTGHKDGQNIYITITGLVNGGGTGIFMGGRTGAAPEEHGALAAAVLDTLKIEYVDPGSVAAPVKPTVAPTTPKPVAGKIRISEQIVVASEQDGDSEIYSLKIGDRHITRLTDNDVYDGECAWSPDGSKIAFVSKRDGNYEIYTMNPDGSEVTRLTDDPVNDFSPAWSPNSQLIAFMTERNGNPDIYLMRADGSKVIPFVTSKGKDMFPAWSYTTQELAFASDQAQDGTFDLYIANTKGQARRITQGIGKVYTPNWSPNGRFIAFANETGKNTDIYIIKPDGADLQRVTDDKAKDYLPKWSPDSNYIMFVSERKGNPDIYITNEAGDVAPAFASKARDTNPEWGPMESK